MATNEDVYKGNNAADYQPPTGNPQSVNTPTVQQGATGVQPTGSGEGALSQSALNQANDLKVMIVQDGSPSSSLTPVQTVTQTWVGPFWGCVALLLVGFVIWAVRQLAKEETPDLGEVIEEAIHEPLLAEESAAAVAPVTKTTKKKTPAKKSAKKPAKRSKKSRK